MIHETFEAYCKDRWDMTRRYADNLICSSVVVKNLENENHGSQKPATESQTRPLTKLSAPLQQEAWKPSND